MWILGALYLAYYLKRGWIPHDDGTLAQSAERVLKGQLPHRDYAEVYTGGLSYLNAFAFRLFGVNLPAIRYMLFAAFLLWIPALYYAASRLGSTLTATSVTLLGIVWSVPGYPAAMPSWYNLFLATFGIVATMRYLKTRALGWMLLAGTLAGLSILCKISGVYFVGAVLLFLVYVAATRPVDPADVSGGKWAFRVVAAIPVTLAALFLIVISCARGSWYDAYQFGLPGTALLVATARRLMLAHENPFARLRSFTVTTSAFLLGVLIPVGAFVGMYATKHALVDLYVGVFVLPLRRLAHASLLPPSPAFAGPSLLVGSVLCMKKGRFDRIKAMIYAAVIVVAVVSLIPRTQPSLNRFVWASIGQSIPLASVALSIVLGRRGEQTEAAGFENRSRVMLVALAAAFCSLVEYPFFTTIYFAYVAPLLLLSLIPVSLSLPMTNRRRLHAVIVFQLVFGVLYLQPMAVPGLGGFMHRQKLGTLDLPRGGLTIGQEEAAEYGQVVELWRAHAGSRVTYAGPDAPELYFLAGLPNETPALFDFLVQDPHFHEHVLAGLERGGATAVALTDPARSFSVLPSNIRGVLEKRFPFSRNIGRFTVRWRE